MNLQLGEYRASTHKQMRVLPPELVAGFDDFTAVFGSGADALSFQSAEVQTTDQRVWVLLVGQRHHLQRWVADVRRPRASFSTVYRGLIPTIPGSLPWLSAVLEPVRAAHFPSLQLLAAPASLATLGRDRSDVRVAFLEARCDGEHAGGRADAAGTGGGSGVGGDGGGVDKEIIVLRDPPVVYVFNIVEHGRRWYRTLVFASDASCSLATLDTSIARHAGRAALVCGDALAPSPPAPSLVISRSISGDQTFLPTRLLQGLLPAALLERYVFWQRDDDHSIEGYPSALLLAEPAVQPTCLHLTLSYDACFLSQSSDSAPSAVSGRKHTAASVSRYRVGPQSADGRSPQPLSAACAPAASAACPTPRNPSAAAPQAACGGAREAGAGPPTALPLDHMWRRLSGSAQPLDDEVLLDLLHAAPGSSLAKLAEVFRRLDDLSHVLAWARVPERSKRSQGAPAHAGRGGWFGGGRDATDEGASKAARGGAETGTDGGDRGGDTGGNGRHLGSDRSHLESLEPALCLIELPRLRLSFEVRPSSAATLAASEESPGIRPSGSSSDISSHTPPANGRGFAKGYSFLGGGRTGGAGGADGADSDDAASNVRLYCREHARFFVSNARPPALSRLLEGLPHAVLLQADDGELAILVSAAARPVVAPSVAGGGGGRGAPGRCLLVRSDSAWLAALPQARHYLYPVHPSHALLSSPSLAASLYLLLLLLIHGRYAEAIGLVDSCSTDSALTAEEAQLWAALAQLEHDDHPDANAARLKLYLMAVDTPSLECPWQLRPSLEAYVLRRSAVSASCRLTAAEEQLLLGRLFEDGSVHWGGGRGAPADKENAGGLVPGGTPPTSPKRSSTPSSPTKVGGGGGGAGGFASGLAALPAQTAASVAPLSRQQSPPFDATAEQQQQQQQQQLRAYYNSLLAIQEAAAAEDNDDDDDTAAEGGGAVRMVHLERLDPPRLTALQSAEWIDLAAPPSALLELAADDPKLKNASLEYYQRPPNSLDEEALDELMRAWRNLSVAKHFMLIYELLTGQLRLKIERHDSGASLGTLLVRSLPPSDWKAGGAATPLVALLLLLTRQHEQLRELHAPSSAFSAASERGVIHPDVRKLGGHELSVMKPKRRETIAGTARGAAEREAQDSVVGGGGAVGNAGATGTGNGGSGTGAGGGIGGAGGGESLAQRLPKYQDLVRETEKEDESGQKLKRALQAMVMGDETARLLVSRARDVLAAAAAPAPAGTAALMQVQPADLLTQWVVGDAFNAPMRAPLSSCQRLLLSPCVANHNCASRTLRPSRGSLQVNGRSASSSSSRGGGSVGPASERQVGFGPLGVSAEFLAGMGSQPLRPLGLSEVIVETEAEEAPSFVNPRTVPAGGELKAIFGSSTDSGGGEAQEAEMWRPPGGRDVAPLPASELKAIFDLSKHPGAQDYTALAMLSRLDKDVRRFHQQFSSKRLYLAKLRPRDVYECVAEAKEAKGSVLGGGVFEPSRLFAGLASGLSGGSRLDEALKATSKLIARLQRLQADDFEAMREGIRAATALANTKPAADSSRDDLAHGLRCMSGDEVSLTFPQLAVQLLSTSAEADLSDLNPRLREGGRLTALLRISAATLLRTTRLAYVAQCRSQARELHVHIESLRERAPGLEPWALDQECREIATRSAALAEALSVHRYSLRRESISADESEGSAWPFGSSASAVENGKSEDGNGHISYGEEDDGVAGGGTDSASDGSAYTYDPRFAVFEFTASIFLRQGQVSLVEQCVRTLRGGGSLVNQMIMGAGKTSTILPLLALLCADGTQLMVQVVPAPLLVFTLLVLRSRFSSVVSKAIYTLHFERATDVSQDLLDKLHAAIHRRAVVVSTPGALKSFALRFIELAHTLDYMSRAEHGKESSVVGSLLRNLVGRFSSAPAKAAKEDDRIVALRGQMRLCKQVLGLFQSGILVLDEIDTILHPLRSELNWPLGGKVSLDFTTDKEAPGMRWLLPFHALDPFFCATGGQAVMEVKHSPTTIALLRKIELAVKRGVREQSLQRVPHLVLLDRRFYREVLRPLLAEWMTVLLQQLGLRVLTPDEAVHYLNGSPGNLLPNKLRDVRGDNKQLKMLNLSFELLETIVPFVLSKVDRVSYGLLGSKHQQQLERADDLVASVAAASPSSDPLRTQSHVPRKRRLLAVPFVGKDTPSRASEFSHPDVVISLTILAYRYEGLREGDFQYILHHLKQTMATQFGPYHKREACRRYVAWVEGAGAHVRGTPRRGGRMRKGGHDAKDRSQGDPRDALEDSVDALANPSQPSLGAPGVLGGQGEQQEEELEVWPLHLLDLGDEEQMRVLFQLLRRQPQVVRHYLFERAFPHTMSFQQMKLSACGQELGGDLLFGRRIGFSGTPSNLLPLELGQCHFAPCDDARMLHVLTSPSVVHYGQPLPADWSAASLLRAAANWTPPLHALIDTGALVTGMSNLEVAHALLGLGLAHMRGCVFIDDEGHKRILLRDGLRVMRLEQCGLAPSERFTFYDQVNTTGMDIPQPQASHAALTLSKDMTFRDYAQGAYRMRGIGQGQRIELLVIPEVQRLIDDAVGAAAGVPRHAMSALRRESHIVDSRRAAAAAGQGGAAARAYLRSSQWAVERPRSLGGALEHLMSSMTAWAKLNPETDDRLDYAEGQRSGEESGRAGDAIDGGVGDDGSRPDATTAAEERDGSLPPASYCSPPLSQTRSKPVHPWLRDEDIYQAARMSSPSEPAARSRVRLRHVVLWLHLNAMRFEKVQFRLLCEQTLANVWRKAGYRWLLDHYTMLGAVEDDTSAGATSGGGALSGGDGGGDGGMGDALSFMQRMPSKYEVDRAKEKLQNCLDVFRNKVALEVAEYAPEKRRDARRHRSAASNSFLSGGIAGILARQPEGSLITEDEQRAACEEVFRRLDEAKGLPQQQQKRGMSIDSGYSSSGGYSTEGDGEEDGEDGSMQTLRDYSAEQEQEQQQEQEEELQMESLQQEPEEPEELPDQAEEKKYVTDATEQLPWAVSLLGLRPEDHKASGGQRKPFYPLSDFGVHAAASTSSLTFPRYLNLSANYYNPSWWREPRRLKNVIMLMEWVPNPEPLDDGDADGSGGDTLGESSAGRGVMSLARQSSRRRNTLPSPEVAAASGAEVGSSPGAGSVGGGEAPLTPIALSDDARSKVRQAFHILDASGEGFIDQRDFPNLLSALGVAHSGEKGEGGLSRSEVDRLFRQVDIDRSGKLDFEEVCRAVAQHRLFEVNPGRYYIAVSLEEAEGLRALLHARRSSGDVLLPGSNATLALRHGGLQFEASRGFTPATEYQAATARQCFRFFDSEVDFTPRELPIILRALQVCAEPLLPVLPSFRTDVQSPLP